MVGNLIATQILASQNLPLGAAMAVLLITLLAGIVLAAGLTLWLSVKTLRLLRGSPL
jgi:ABC-type spermidine/putrescine transport system permease subunit I